ncbi:MAG: response regulator transcription factor [Lachnospiraceae bacterium]|jgi:DNA-binding response OmpR family regulator|nr:response regulator transcription factor [Lachnospiraceae bacterium]
MTDILIIEDDSEIAGLVRDFLIADGYSCEIRRSGEAGLSFIKYDTPRIVLLDINLPGIDGFSVCDEIHRGQNIPLIIVSARGTKDDKLQGLNLGADDYIEKPFDIDLLKAKVSALYRRHYGADPLGNKLVVGNLTIDDSKRTAFFDGKPLELNPKEFDLLFYLAQNAGKALRKDTLLNWVWGADCFSEPATLTVHIKRLRDKIEKDSANPRHILTVWGVGYKYEG